MTDEYLLEQCYCFESFRKKIQTTPLNEIFTKEEILEIESLCIEPHCCHSNSAEVALYFDCLYSIISFRSSCIDLSRFGTSLFINLSIAI